MLDAQTRLLRGLQVPTLAVSALLTSGRPRPVHLWVMSSLLYSHQDVLVRQIPRQSPVGDCLDCNGRLWRNSTRNLLNHSVPPLGRCLHFAPEILDLYHHYPDIAPGRR
jgi:hypothetical protein